MIQLHAKLDTQTPERRTVIEGVNVPMEPLFRRMLEADSGQLGLTVIVDGEGLHAVLVKNGVTRWV